MSELCLSLPPSSSQARLQIMKQVSYSEPLLKAALIDNGTVFNIYSHKCIMDFVDLLL